MSFNVISAKFTDSPHSSKWAQAYEFEPQDLIKAKTKGILYAVISTSTPLDGVEKVLSGREILSRLHEEYFGKEKGKSFTTLKNAVNKVLDEFSYHKKIEIAAACYLPDTLYLVVGGGGQIAILRDETISSILKSSKDKVVSASGHPKDNDILIIASSSLFTNLTTGEMKAALSSKDVNQAAEYIAPKIHSKEGGELGVIFLKFEKKPKDLAKDHQTSPPKLQKKFKISEKSDLKKARKPALIKKVKRVISKVKSKILLESKPAKAPPIPFYENIKKGKKFASIYVKGQDNMPIPQKTKVSLSIGLILIFLLVVSIGFGIKQKKIKEYKNRYKSTLDQASHELNESFEVYPINPARARELFNLAQGKILGLKDEGINDPDLEKLTLSLEENEGNIMKVFKQEPNLFVDLSLLTSGFMGDLMASGNDRIYILDKEGEKVVEVILKNKRSEVVSGPDQINKPYSLASYEDRVFILNSKGAFEVGERFDKAVDVDWVGEVLPYAYAGNFYILEKEKSAIWRYSGVKFGFSAKSNWLAPGVSVDLSKAHSWVIDGSVWILTESNQILKLSLGNLQNFNIKNVSPELTNPSEIYTNEELENLYILDRERSRVVVVNKDGEYVAQYVHDTLKLAKNLTASEKDKKIILLTGDKLVSIEMKHLD